MPRTVVIYTSGSRGDVQPYVALGLELVARGAKVFICTEKRMEGFVKMFPEVGYLELAGDPVGLIYEQSSQALLAEGKIMKLMMEVDKFNRPFADEVLRTAAAAGEAAGADLVVTAALTQTVSMCVAEKLGAPWVPVYLGPIWPTREFPSWALSPKPWSWKWANKLSYKLMLGALWMQEKGRINAWRKASLGLGPVKGGPLAVIRAAAGDIPAPLMCTPLMAPGQAAPPDYPDYVQFTGFAFVPPTKEADVDPQLRAFVDAGDAPVYLGFGSMPAPDPRRLLEMAAEVARKTGRRAVLVAGMSGAAALVGSGDGQVQLPPEVLLVPSAPHDWLLPRCCAVVHHAGVGTCAAALRAGVPSVPCPVMLDQTNNALRLQEAGCAAPPLPFQALTVEALAEHITAVCADEGMRARAQEVAAGLERDWRGVAQAADIVLAAPNPWPKVKAAGVV